MATGVTGNIEEIGLEELGIVTNSGAITINEYNQTNIPNIYAIGDVSGRHGWPMWHLHKVMFQQIMRQATKQNRWIFLIYQAVLIANHK